MKYLYLLLCLFGLYTFSAQAQNTELLTQYPEVLDGSVQAISIDEENDRIILGGNFSQLRNSENILVPFLNIFELSGGNLPMNLPFVDGEVTSIVDDGQGGVFLGGDFTKVGNFDRDGMARVNAEGQVTALDLDLNGSVYDIHLDSENGVIYIGGDFTLVEGVERENFVALNSSTFDILPIAPLINGPVYDIEQDADTLYLSGSFTGAGELAQDFLIYDQQTEEALEPFETNGTITDVIDDGNGGFFLTGTFTIVADSMRNGIAHVDASGQPTPWSIDIEANAPLGNMAVNSVLLSGDTLYLGGRFNVVNGVTRKNLAAVSAQTGALFPWNPKTKIVDSSTFVYKIGFLNDSILVAGNFNRIDNEQIKYLALVDKVQGNVSLQFDALLDGQVRNFDVEGNFLHLVGLFDEVLGTPRTRICTIDLTNFDIPFDQIPIFSGGNEDIVAVGDTVFLGGGFSRPGVSNASFGAFRRSTSEWIEMNLETNGQVIDLELDGDKLYLGGWFREVRSETREHYAAINVQTLEVTDDAFSFSPSSLTFQGVQMVKKIGSRVYLTSTVERVNKYRRLGFMALTTLGEVTETTAPINISQLSTPVSSNPLYEVVRDIEIVGDRIYLAGDFTASPQVSSQYIISVNRYTGNIEPLIAEVDLPVKSLSAGDAKIYFAGEFNVVNGESTPYLSRINLATNSVDNWPTSGFVEGAIVNDVFVSNGEVLIGGNFFEVGGSPRNNFAAFDSESLELSDVRPDPDDEVLVVYENNGNALAGGKFKGFNANPVFATEPNFAVLEKSSGLPIAISTFPNDMVNQIVLTEDYIVLAGAFTQVGDSSREGIAILDRQTLELTTLGRELNAINDDFTVRDILVDGDRLYYVGLIRYQGNNEPGIGALSLTSGQLDDWPQPNLLTNITVPGDNAPPAYYSLAVSDSTVFIGGEFRVEGPNNPP
ncbi:MAG: hypothetical protein WBG42_17010, partial [Cryomorphaceae bacterium]